MRLIMCERQGLEEPEVTLAYSEMTTGVQRVADYVKNVDQTILCKKDNEEYGVFINDIFRCIDGYSSVRKYFFKVHFFSFQNTLPIRQILFWNLHRHILIYVLIKPFIIIHQR